jgi:hypothetical protein
MNFTRLAVLKLKLSMRRNCVFAAVLMGACLLSGVRTPAQQLGVMNDATGLGISPTGGPAVNANVALASVDAVTGAGVATLPILLPAARGTAQPSLALQYNSQRGIREAGIGWSFEMPAIERKPLWGSPQYPTSPGAERFEFSGRPLIFICNIDGNGVCQNGFKGGEENRPWARGWAYFRLQTEGLFSRFYLSADGKTWRVLEMAARWPSTSMR